MCVVCVYLVKIYGERPTQNAGNVCMENIEIYIRPVEWPNQIMLYFVRIQNLNKI